MWIPTYHVFPSRAVFLAACDAVGWFRAPDDTPMPPEGVTLVELGPLIAPPSIGRDGMPIQGDVLDPRYHVNAAWHGVAVPEVFRTTAVAPAAPNRCFALPAPTTVEPPVPHVIPAWKGKTALREAGLLNAVEMAVAAAGGRVQDAWAGASEWSRDSDFLLALAEGLGLRSRQVDDLFRSADGIQS